MLFFFIKNMTLGIYLSSKAIGVLLPVPNDKFIILLFDIQDDLVLVSISYIYTTISGHFEPTQMSGRFSIHMSYIRSLTSPWEVPYS